MRRATFALAAAVCVAVSLVVAQGVGAAGATTCTGTFTGTANDLVVPSGATCILSEATIKHDVTVQSDANLGAGAGTAIGHDLTATQANEIVLGLAGPLKVGHDVTITGTDATPTFTRFYDVCNTTIGHDLRITGTTSESQGLSVGDVGPGEPCTIFDPGAEPNTVGHDLVVTGNTSGTNIDVGNNSAGHDLVVSGNKAATYIDVSDNTVGHDATCSGNNPTQAPDGPEDGPNSAGHKNTCG